MSDDTFTAADFESAASSEPASAPVETAAPVETTTPLGAATTEPVVDTAATASTSTEAQKPAGPIPFDVHKTALDNARTKAVEDYKQRYGWAEQVNQQDLQEAIRIAQLAQRDPMAYAQELINDLQQHPTYGPQLRSMAARALAQARGQQQTEQEPQPDLPIQLEDGRVVHLYSAAQQAKREAFLQKQWMQSVQQELQPLKQTHEQMQAQRAAEQEQAQDHHFASTFTANVKSWPGVDDAALKEMAQLIAAEPSLPAKPSYEQLQLVTHAAYQKVVVPRLQRTERQTVLDTIKQQANAGTVNPARTSARAPKSMDEMSIAEALAHVATQNA